MNSLDVVLYNDCGCEIARETITKEKTEADIIDSWELYPGDKIQLEETWHEDMEAYGRYEDYVLCDNRPFM